MKTSKELRELIAAAFERIEAITAIGKEEDRDLTPEETAEIDAIMGAGDEPGKIGKLETELKRVEKIEARQARLADERAPDATADNGPQAIVIPPRCRFSYRQLRAYAGEQAEEHAFTAGMWALATLARHEGAQEWCREHGIAINYHRSLFESPQAAHSTTSVEKGGYLVPTEMERSIIKLRENYGVFRRNAKLKPMASDTLDVPVRSSGLTGYWSGDNQALTASDMTYSNAKLVAKKLYAFSKYSSEIAEDAIIDFGDELTDELAHVLAYNEDLAAFIGDGTSTYGQCVGIINALQAGSEHEALSGNTAFSTLDLVDFESMMGQLPDFPGIDPKWYISKIGWAASMLRLLDAAGGNTIATLGDGQRSPIFLGYPVEFTQVMNTTVAAQVSTEGLVYFGDLRLGALLGDRRGIAVAVSDQRYFEYDQLAIRATERIDINIHGAGSASAAGPIIGLKTPGS